MPEKKNINKVGLKMYWRDRNIVQMAKANFFLRVPKEDEKIPKNSRLVDARSDYLKGGIVIKLDGEITGNECSQKYIEWGARATFVRSTKNIVCASSSPSSFSGSWWRESPASWWVVVIGISETLVVVVGTVVSRLRSRVTSANRWLCAIRHSINLELWLDQLYESCARLFVAGQWIDLWRWFETTGRLTSAEGWTLRVLQFHIP